MKQSAACRRLAVMGAEGCLKGAWPATWAGRRAGDLFGTQAPTNGHWRLHCWQQTDSTSGSCGGPRMGTSMFGIMAQVICKCWCACCYGPAPCLPVFCQMQALALRQHPACQQPELWGAGDVCWQSCFRQGPL